MTTITPKDAMLSALYFILVIILGFLLNIGLAWIIDNWVLPLMNWFNGLSFFWKFILFMFGGYAIFYIILNAVKLVTSLISILVFSKLPENLFTMISSTMIYLINLGWLVYGLWEITPKFGVWIFLEFILLVIFIGSATSVLMPWYLKAKIKNEQERAFINRGF